jgi:hypothetical protein
MSFHQFPAGTQAILAAPTVSPEALGYTNSAREDITDPVECGAQFNISGDEFRCTDNGTYSNNRGAWLDSGSPSKVWVIFNRTAGLTNWDTLSSGVRYQLNVTRTFTLSRPTPGSDTISGQFQMYDAATGGNLLGSGGAGQTWTATQTVDPCPICCFTPETLIEMARGIAVPISSIREGDEILTANGPEVVKEIITRVNRVMYRITFSDGTFVNASEDHPLDVDGSPRSVNPIIDYKHVGLPEKLEVGDIVTTRNGKQRIIRIEQIEYPGMVYTLGNVMFYANGILVY